MNKKIRLDLFQLHDSKDSIRSWIVAKGRNLKSDLSVLVDKTMLSKTQLVKHLMRKFNMSIASAERLVYLKKEWYPLVYIKELVYLSRNKKFSIQDSIEFLKCSQPPVVEYRAVKELTIDLCKLTGAHAADGTLRGNYLAITDHYKSNLLALIQWFNDFDYAPKLVKVSKNEFGVKFHSTIISRYFGKFFDFPSGCKQYTVSEPTIIRNAPIEYRKAFALGALTFEAGVGIRNQVEFCVASKEFRNSITDILTELNIKYNSMNRQSSGYWRFWSNKLTKEQANSWLTLFEPNTEKWHKINDSINGFTRKARSFEEAVEILDSVYPKQSASKISIKDILLAFRELNKSHRYELAKYLAEKRCIVSFGGKWAHPLKHYLDILRKANMISVERHKFGKKKSFGSIVREVYIYNPKTHEWRLPDRHYINMH